MNHLEKACEEIDASVFSSDMLFADTRRAMLKDYVGRWTRAIAEHEHSEQDQPAAASGWIPVGERLPETGVLVVVRYPATEHDWTTEDNISFDFISEDHEDWHNHCESYEHFMAVGGSGAAGEDSVCIGPAQKAPYTHWAPIPAIQKAVQP